MDPSFFEVYLTIPLALLVIANPLGILPVYINLTAHLEKPIRKRIVRRASLTVILVLVIAFFLGETILAFLGVGMPSFRIGGSLPLLLLSLSMLQAKSSRTRQTPEEMEEAEEDDTLGVVPVGIPLLAGPGTISTAILLRGTATTPEQIGVFIASAFLVGGVSYLTLTLSKPIAGLLGRTGINIMTRLGGLLLAAFAVEIMSRGLLELFPGLAG